MFQEEKMIFPQAGCFFLYQGSLQVEPLLIGYSSQPARNDS
jgi:hypothetical protein